MTHKPLKILIALQYYVPHRTGLTLYVQRIAEALAQRGHEVTVLTARYDMSLPRDEQVINGVRVVRLWAPLRVSRGMVMPAYPWAAWKLVQEHDVVSLHVPTLETALYAVYTRLLKKGLLITHHGDLILPKGAFNRFVEWFTFQLYLIAGRIAPRIIAYSEDYADNSYYITPFREKTCTVYPPISIPIPDPQRVEALRDQWLSGTNGKARLIGYAGRFVEEKRPDVLINALPIIQQKYPGTKIVFAGQYKLKYEHFYTRHHDLIRQYQDSIVFLDLITDEQEVANFYAACDVLALPSDTECFALVQVEAMRCGTPVVSTDIPGAREVVRVTGMGEIVPPGNPQAFGDAVARVLDHRSDYVKPLAEIDAVFNLEKTIDHYEQHLRNAFETARKTEDGGTR
ncbi:MAG: glycosyltransferase family 4 protein [Anaerolineae bacterium]|nr:glycosyltransferase family 4 protein [Anaerolineae bacterium]